jgi:putative transposase
LVTIFPTAAEQRCSNHRLVNLLDELPKTLQGGAKTLLTKVPYVETRAEAERQKRANQAWCTKRGCAEAGRALGRDWERLVTFYQFQREHWKHLRTTNPVESPFAVVRLRTATAKGYKEVDNGAAVIWKTLRIAEQCFRRLDAPELLPEVAEGTAHVDGKRVKLEREVEKQKAAA